MDSLAFGATCFLFIAIHTTRRAISEATVGEGAVDVVKRKIYVDDYLGSAKTMGEGVKEASIVKGALAKADLHFQDWILNSVEFLQAMQNGRESSPGDVPQIKRIARRCFGLSAILGMTSWGSVSTTWQTKKTSTSVSQAR